MSEEKLIEVKGVSKKFCPNLKHSIQYGIRDIAFNLLGLSSKPEKLRKDEFWAVDNVSFNVCKGETLGIVGPNGAGKSTVLKMLNGIFMPDKGEIEVRGKVGALIEIGAGFHPMLTGRENIYVNGAIMGMRKKEMDEKLSDIIEFADIGEFIDSPVKFYSSGMYVRLGFSVAAHLEPDILLVDEVLSVGDSSFRVKCYERINELKDRGIPIVYVSHNLDSVAKLCDRAIYLKNGQVHTLGEAEKAVYAYEQDYSGSKTGAEERFGTGDVIIEEVKTLDDLDNERNSFNTGERLKIKIFFDAKKRIVDPYFNIGIVNSEGIYCVWAKNSVDGFHINFIEGEGAISIEFPTFELTPNRYKVVIGIFGEDHFVPVAVDKRVHFFTITSNKRIERISYVKRKWKMELDAKNE